jgi:hypothetical protein
MVDENALSGVSDFVLDDVVDPPVPGEPALADDEVSHAEAVVLVDEYVTTN